MLWESMPQKMFRPTEGCNHGSVHLGHARHAADEEDLGDFRLRDARILEAVLARLPRAVQQAIHQLLELAARHRQAQVLCACGQHARRNSHNAG